MTTPTDFLLFRRLPPAPQPEPNGRACEDCGRALRGMERHICPRCFGETDGPYDEMED